MTKYKVGDILRPIDRTQCGNFNDSLLAVYIRITKVIGGSYEYDILDKNLEKISDCCSCFKDDNLVCKGGNKLSNLMKRLLSKNTRTLYRAGMIEGNLELTNKAKEILEKLSFEKYKDELLEVAKKELKKKDDGF